MTFEYCPVCGNKLVPRVIGDEGDIPYCEDCGRPFFPFSYPCVICLCADEDDNVLLIKQSYGIKRNVCVAGYIKSGESAEECCRREIAEETGLEVLGTSFLYSRYYAGHDNLMLAFVCRVKHAETILSSEVSEARWFRREEAESALFEGAFGIDMLHRWKELENEGAVI
ncbi:MAG: NUDIX domain-containing protein [Ruminiclostridium sp.]|nr:NUDIX domain-containing protein [Ruminiclostridium sp.]